jgi:hypothetical protein
VPASTVNGVFFSVTEADPGAFARLDRVSD